MSTDLGSEMVNVGRALAELRESAGLTQAQMAERLKRTLTISPAGISRIEAGDRLITDDEFNAYLDALDSEEAGKFREFYAEPWTELERPAFDHADRDVLFEAEKVLREIHELYENPELKSVFRKQVERYESDLRQLAHYLEVRDHLLAIVGSIGVGKSTQICRVTGLEIKSDDAVAPEPVLEVGGGGITICEVHIKRGPGYGIIIEPCSDAEIKADVADLCEHLIGVAHGRAEDASGDGNSLGISKETVRAIKNMAKLSPKKVTQPDGKVIRIDRAKELAAKIGDPKELLVQILSQMGLARRDRRDIWYSKESGKSPLVWLRETFAAINNGRHEDFSIPKRIEVIVPTPLLGPKGAAPKGEQFNIRVVDTKGVDQTAGRADLECHFDDPHTIVVLCSRFNDAPETSTQQLLERARDARVQHIPTKACIVVLPRADEALAMKDDETGVSVDDHEEGYLLKREQVEMRIAHLGVSGLPIEFFNARRDDPNQLRDFFLDRIKNLRLLYRTQLEDLIRTIRGILANHGKEQYREILRTASGFLKGWVANNRSTGQIADYAHEALLAAMQSAHAATIRATVERAGEWPNLDYYHHLGFGARKIAANCFSKKVEDLKVVGDTILQNAELSEVHDYVKQVIRFVDTSVDALLQKIQLAGRSAFSADLTNAVDLWNECKGEWGMGPGYRDRVSVHNRDWFSSSSLAARHDFIKRMIVNGWDEIIANVNEMLEADPTAE
jgi:transcriptional regulator with XRE-family HTH domain